MFKFFKAQELTILVATKQHIPEIAIVTKVTYARTFIDPKSSQCCFNENELEGLKDHVLSSYPKLLNDPEHLLLVLEEKSQVIGYAKLDLKDSSVFLDRIYILPEKQAKGYGNQLLLTCFKQTLEYFKKDKMSLEVWDENKKAISYYEKNGFKITPKMHYKTAASGITYSGFEMQCDHVLGACQKLEFYMSETKQNPEQAKV